MSNIHSYLFYIDVEKKSRTCRKILFRDSKEKKTNIAYIKLSCKVTTDDIDLGLFLSSFIGRKNKAILRNYSDIIVKPIRIL